VANTTLRVLRYRKVRWLYLAGFIAYLQLNFFLYVNSNFVGDIIGERGVGLIYIAGALLSIIAFVGASHVLREIGNYRALVLFTALQIAILFGIVVSSNPLVVLLLDVLLLALEPAIFFSLDIFLENYSHPAHGEDDRTGGVRGLYLGITNMAFVTGPFLMGAVVGPDENFKSAYVISAFLLILFLATIALRFRNFVDPPYQTIGVRGIAPVFRTLFRSRDLTGVFGAQLFLRLYYAWSVVYIPLYLHAHLGFSWLVIGVMLTLTTIPYVIFEIPLGRIADKYLGEKELMIFGFVILSGSIAAISYVSTPSVLIWSLILFLGSTGGSIIEVTTESYFFKKIDSSHAHILTLFRTIQPTATVVGILLGSALLFVLPLQYTFIIIGAIVLFGVGFALTLRDTR